jgi:predicted nucleic acid-binding protein
MVIVDTSVWIDALRGNTNSHVLWLRAAILREEIGLTSLILCEVLQGVLSDREFLQFRSDLIKFAVFESDGIELAIASAQNYRTLRQKGLTIRRTMDCIIATFCIENGHQLLHKDRDFDAFERHLGLRVAHP